MTTTLSPEGRAMHAPASSVTEPAELLAGVELGGTKCICILGTSPADIREQARVETRAPEATLADIQAVLERWRTWHGPIAALGLATFGPLDLAPRSPTYGHITSTPKLGWQNTNVVGHFERRLGIPIGFDTDVNGAALAERRWGAGQGLSDFAYITVGTGVGVGLIVAGRPVFGSTHTEMGHIRPARRPGDDWPGVCSFHRGCVEGLASGPAIEARVGVPAERLGPEHPVWEPVAYTLGQLLHTLVLTTAPKRVLLGGGVMSGQLHLFERIRRELQSSLNGYVAVEEIARNLAQFVGPPGLGVDAGPLGALALAADAAARASAIGMRPARPAL